MSIRYLILALTRRCNLECSYCYNGRPAAEKDMSLEIINQALSLVTGQHPFHLQLTGGEPTLVPELVEKAASLAWSSVHCHSIGLQTNATCLTPEIIDLFKKYFIQVGVSLDGPPTIHEQQRGKAAETLKGIQLLEQSGYPFGVTTVVTQLNTPVLDRLVLTLAGFSSARGIGLDLLINKGRAKKQSHVALPDKQSLKNGTRKMLSVLKSVNDIRDAPIRLRERDLLLNSKTQKRSVFCHACLGESLAVDPEGKIFPCGQTMGDSDFSAGTVWEPEYKYLKRLFESKPKESQCSKCPLEGFCPGDCPSRLHYNQSDNQALICDLYQTIWEEERDVS